MEEIFFFLRARDQARIGKDQKLETKEKFGKEMSNPGYESFNFILTFSTCSHGIWYLLLLVHGPRVWGCMDRRFYLC